MTLTTTQDVSIGAETSGRGWRLLASVAAWAPIVALAWFVWPVALGGSTSFVFVSGESMTPTFQPGDLVVARALDVAVGDVIIYAPEGFGGAQIVHRVTGGDATGWTVQGDANTFVDPFTPSGEEIRGVVVAHVPGVGAVMHVLVNPLLWVGILLIAAALVAWPERKSP